GYHRPQAALPAVRHWGFDLHMFLQYAKGLRQGESADGAYNLFWVSAAPGLARKGGDTGSEDREGDGARLAEEFLTGIGCLGHPPTSAGGAVWPERGEIKGETTVRLWVRLEEGPDAYHSTTWLLAVANHITDYRKQLERWVSEAEEHGRPKPI